MVRERLHRFFGDLMLAIAEFVHLLLKFAHALRRGLPPELLQVLLNVFQRVHRPRARGPGLLELVALHLFQAPVHLATRPFQRFLRRPALLVTQSIGREILACFVETLEVVPHFVAKPRELSPQPFTLFLRLGVLQFGDEFREFLVHALLPPGEFFDLFEDLVRRLLLLPR